MRFFTMLLVVLLGTAAFAQVDLVLDQDSVVLEGGTYSSIDLSGCKYVTLRNVTVKNTTGNNDYAGIKMQGSKYIWLDRCEVDGSASTSSGYGTCGAVKPDGSSRIYIRECELHNCNDDGVRAYNSTYLYVSDCKIYHLIGCGTDGGCSSCNNGHSDGFQIITCIKSYVQRNLVYDIKGNACFFIHGTSKFGYIYNNIFYAPAVGLPTYVADAEDVKFNNNVVWGVDQGTYGGLALGNDLYRFEMYNNIIWNVKTDHTNMIFTYDSSQHQGDYNLFGEASTGTWPRGDHSIVNSDPGFANMGTTAKTVVTWDDFALKSTAAAKDKGIAATTDLTEIPNHDFFKRLRDSSPDIGAIEYPHTGARPRVWFTASNREGQGPLNVTFSNASTSDFTGFSWDFGDGGSSTDQAPTHTYTAAGKYTVTLIGTGADGLTDTLVVKFYVVVTGGSAVADRAPRNILTGMEVYPDPMQLEARFQHPQSNDVTIRITDHLGRQVRTLRNQNVWDGRNNNGIFTAPGMYFYDITVDGYQKSGRIVKVR